MKDLLINSIMNNIVKYKDYDESKLRIIRYGLSSLYLHITKVVVTFTIAYFLGLLVTLLKLMAFYSLIRLTAFGVHAKKSVHCWISSLTIFILLAYICEIVNINIVMKLCISIICIILLTIYAPADTEKRPLINSKKRRNFKIITVINSIILTCLLFFVKDNILNNCILFGLILGTFVVLPITYKLFGVNYNNYKNYKKSE